MANSKDLYKGKEERKIKYFVMQELLKHSNKFYTIKTIMFSIKFDFKGWKDILDTCNV